MREVTLQHIAMYSEWVVDGILLSKVEGPPGPPWAGGPATTGIIGIVKRFERLKKVAAQS
jgi:hypothetical protein